MKIDDPPSVQCLLFLHQYWMRGGVFRFQVFVYLGVFRIIEKYLG